MLKIQKIENGLIFRGGPWHFTSNLLPNGYEILDEHCCHVELEQNIICFLSYETEVDGEVPADSRNLIELIGLKIVE